MLDAKVTSPDANTRGQTGSAATRARSRCPASRKAAAKKVGQSGQEANIQPPSQWGAARAGTGVPVRADFSTAPPTPATLRCAR